MRGHAGRSAKATHFLAMHSFNGQDFDKAARLFRLAADQGFAPAQSNYGYCEYEGLRVIQDGSRWSRDVER
eukprot:CAMPEP_0180086074 /NCGR_PEP_ID=MMETSP0985-20121206/20844_1 /TAXON_ID=483367 /ORGANISM="non described non described, Strain CCMP 2436" /LENGTH=70 /DNA_ID=CAMNT_0022020065 /DNA_START=22 /DNA_END=231 /DNA_ORIENTATION=+